MRPDVANQQYARVRAALAALAMKWSALAIAVAVLGASCAAPKASPEPTTLVLGTVWPGAAWDRIGQSLATAYTDRLPNVHAVAKASGNLDREIKAFEEGATDLAILDVETAYLAFNAESRDEAPARKLRAVAVLLSTAVQIVARNDADVRRVTDLRGKRVGVGAKGTPTERAARLILQSHGVPFESIRPTFASGDAAEALRTGNLDALFLYSPFQNPLIAEMAEAGSVRLIPIDRSAIPAIQEQHHFLKATTIPGGTYKNQDDDLLTVGMDVLLVCRQDLAEPLVYDLARTLFESVPQLKKAHASASAIDPDRGPTAAIPLHPGAARYYREREILK
jgi:TRAP transporter TAXI family solute receptor